jgi:hypothetical protein
MAVGFVLPPGTRSRANTDQPQAILQQFLPWGDSGNDTRDEFSAPGSPENNRFLQTFQGRYGKARPGQPIPDVPGLHHTDYESALTEIATSNPGWFAERGFGSATGRTDPSRQEIFDAQYAANIHQEVIDEARRLGLGSGGTGTTPDLTILRQDLATLARQVQSARDASETEERRWWLDRIAKEVAKLDGPGPGQRRAVRELRALAAERPLAPPTQIPSPSSGATVDDVRQDIRDLSARFQLARRATGMERLWWQDRFKKEVARLEGEGRKPFADELRALAAERPLEGLPT